MKNATRVEDNKFFFKALKDKNKIARKCHMYRHFYTTFN